MPRAGGIYSLPAGYLATTGQTILASQHNPPLEDIAAALTGSLPRDGSAPMQANLSMGGFKVTGAANGVDPTDAATFGQLSNLISVGVVWDFAGSTVPAGWLLCYGQAVSRATYAALFTAIGTQFGAGDGATTFNIPDLRGCVVAGLDNMGGASGNRLFNFFGAIAHTLGGLLGTSSVTLANSQMPSHSHGGNSGAGGVHNHNFTYNSVGGSGGDAGGGPGFTRFFPTSGTTDVAAAHTHSISPDGGDQAHSNAQPTRMMNKIIKAF